VPVPNSLLEIGGCARDTYWDGHACLGVTHSSQASGEHFQVVDESTIAAVVDDFIDRVMHNPVLNANPAVDEAHHRVSAAGFKYYVTEMVCWATGGPQKYTGRAMGESHKRLKITDHRG